MLSIKVLFRNLKSSILNMLSFLDMNRAFFNFIIVWRSAAVLIFSLFSALVFISGQNAACAYGIADAINSAKIYNDSIQASKQQKDITVIEKKDATVAGFLPKVTLQNDSIYTKYTQRVPGNDTNQYRQNTVSVAQSIFAFGRTSAAVRAGTHDALSAEHKYHESVNTLITKVIDAYVGVQAYRNRYYVSLQREIAASEILEQVAVKFENGFVTKTDLLRAKADYASAISDKEAVLAKLREQEGAFAYFVGTPPPRDMMAIDVESVVLPSSNEELINNSVLNNLTVKEVSENWQSDKIQKSIAMMEMLPEFSVRADFIAYSKKRNINSGSLINNNTYTLSLSVPIFNRGLEYVKISSATHREKLSEYLYHDKVNYVATTAESTWNQWKALKTNLDADVETVKYYSEAFEGMKEQFNYGTRSLTDLSQQEILLFRKKEELIQTEQNIISAVFKMKALSDELKYVDFDKISKKSDSSFNEVQRIMEYEKVKNLPEAKVY